MKLFQFLAASVLFVSCAPQKGDPPATQRPQPSGGAVSDSSPETKTLPKPIRTPEENSGLSVNNVVDTDETDDLANEPSSQTTQQLDPRKLTPMTEELPAVDPPASSPSEEEITSMEEPLPENLTEDQILVAGIESKYSEYIELKEIWEAQLPRIEDIISRAVNPGFLAPFLKVQEEIEKAPATKAQIEEIKEKLLLDEGIFSRPEDRVKAQRMRAGFNVHVETLSSGISLSLNRAELAESDPSVMYDVAAFLPETEEEPAEEELTADYPSPSAAEETTAVVDPAQDVPAVADVQQENTEDSSTLETQNLSTATAPSTDVIDSVEEQQPPSPGKSTVEPAVASAPTASASPAEPASEETTTVAETSDAVSENTAASKTANTAKDSVEPWSWDWIVTSTASAWDSFVESITPSFLANPAGYVLRPTQSSVEPGIPVINRSETVIDDAEMETEETSDNPEQAQARQLIDQLLQSVYQSVQTRDIKNLEELKAYIAEIPRNPEERTADQVNLLDTADQAFQNRINSSQPLSIADFVEFSGYTLEGLSSEEIVEIVNVLFEFTAKAEEQKIQTQQVQGEELTQVQGEELTQVQGEELAQAQGEELTQAQGEELTQVQGAELTQAQGEELTQVQGAELTQAQGEELTQVQGASSPANE